MQTRKPGMINQMKQEHFQQNGIKQTHVVFIRAFSEIHFRISFKYYQQFYGVYI